MTNEATAGVSKRSLLLLGGLAALALNKDTRRALVGGTKQVWHGAGATLDERVRPALALAATQAQELAHEAAQRGASTYETLREEAPVRAHSLLESARVAAGDLATSAQERATILRDEAQVIGGVGAKKATRTLDSARKSAGQTLDEVVKPALVHAQGAGLGLYSEVKDRVQDVLGEGADTVEGKRRQAEKLLGRARKEAERELRSARRQWQPQKLEAAVNRKVASLQKELGRELKVLEKQARLARRDDRGSGLSGGLTTLLLLGTGAVVLARVPAARQGILSAVGSVNPDAAEALHKAGRNVRNIVGSVWMERLEEPTTPPAATAANQVASAAASAPEQPTPKKTDDEPDTSVPSTAAQSTSTPSKSTQSSDASTN